MSLINQMLQDLDARGGAQGAEAMQSNVKSVARNEGRQPLKLAGGGLLLLVVLGAAGYYGWTLQRPRAGIAAPAPVKPVKTVLLTPRAAPVAAPSAFPQAAEQVPPAAKPKAARTDTIDTAREQRLEKRKAKREEKLLLAAAKIPSAGPPQMNAQQRAESEYRRGLAMLQEGRIGEAIASLEQALQIDPRHEAARQTLVGLLIENKRPDDAMRQLQLALAAEPRQPAMAMLLARLQIERGAPGIDTLQQTLPYAAGNAEYHAFLAGALQRQQRHGEAAEQYQAALRTNPQNGVWMMGLGISLQAEKRNPEALDAFQKAKSSARLSPELQAFVERKLQQLSH